MTHLRTLTIVLAALLLAGCGNTTEASSGASPNVAWTAPEQYTFVVDSSCGERALIGRFEVAVADGTVEAVEGLDESGRSMLEHGFEDEVPTLTELLEEAERARSEGADVVTVDRAADGHPTRVEIDWDTNAVDDEACYVITEFSPPRVSIASKLGGRNSTHEDVGHRRWLRPLPGWAAPGVPAEVQ